MSKKKKKKKKKKGFLIFLEDWLPTGPVFTEIFGIQRIFGISPKITCPFVVVREQKFFDTDF